MADFAPLQSSQYSTYDSTPKAQVHGAEWDGKLRTAVGALTFTSAGTGTASMVRLPAGRKLIFPDLSRIVCPVGTTNADLHVGHTAYTQADGTAVEADDNAFADNVDVGGGAIDAAFSLPAAPYFVMDSREDVDINIMIDTANSPAAGVAYVVVAYAMAR